jgi:RecA/RadA recombinase
MKRVKLVKAAKERANGGGNYFTNPKTKLKFISTGCKMFDLALGGGWAENRISNIVGDKSTGKTLLCIEAAANFAHQVPQGSHHLP